MTLCPACRPRPPLLSPRPCSPRPSSPAS